MADRTWALPRSISNSTTTAASEPPGQALCTAMAQTVETDYRILSSWFGGVQGRFLSDLHAEPGNNGASHFDCGARDIHFDWMPTKSANWARMLSDSEIVEVFEANFNGDWQNCSNSTGEGLSRVLAECMYPGNVVKKSGKSPAATWLDGGACGLGAIQQGHRSGLSLDGVSVLFLNWLRYQLGFHWDDIVCAALNIGDLTLERLYQVFEGRGVPAIIPALEKAGRRSSASSTANFLQVRPQT